MKPKRNLNTCAHAFLCLTLIISFPKCFHSEEYSYIKPKSLRIVHDVLLRQIPGRPVQVIPQKGQLHSKDEFIQFYSKGSAGRKSNFKLNLDITKSPNGCKIRNLSGPLPVSTKVPTLKQISRQNSEVQMGGYYSPRNCTPQQLLAILVPLRNRTLHFRALLNHLHPILQRQAIAYQIFAIEQDDYKKFNKGRLFNIGFVEALKLRQFDCLILHDVDLYVEDDRLLYRCGDLPHHMSVALDKFKYQNFFRLFGRDTLGGVISIKTDQFKKINGYSNSFWGWGGEDNDFGKRVFHHFKSCSVAPIEVARFKMAKHAKRPENRDRMKLLAAPIGKSAFDGLSNLHYDLRQLIFHKLFTLVQVAL